MSQLRGARSAIRRRGCRNRCEARSEAAADNRDAEGNRTRTVYAAGLVYGPYGEGTPGTEEIEVFAWEEDPSFQQFPTGTPLKQGNRQ